MDWTQAMKQEFEFFSVDPGTWSDVSKLDGITSASIDRDDGAETLGSATIDADGLFGEAYIRAYLKATQGVEEEQQPLGTFMIQTPSSDFDGMNQSSTMDAYTPLIELKEKNPPLGYFVAKGANIMESAYAIARENMRGPVVPAYCEETLYEDFVANTDDTWATFLSALCKKAGYSMQLDELSRLLFAPNQDPDSMQPVWTYTDDNASILYPEATIEHDLYGVPNVVEVVYSGEGGPYYARAVNDDPTSPLSTVSRGREIHVRITDPQFPGEPNQAMVDAYAKQQLEERSQLQCTVTYAHGFCPVRMGDCVRLDFDRAQIKGVKAVVTRQHITCEPGCKVEETAKFTFKIGDANALK